MKRLIHVFVLFVLAATIGSAAEINVKKSKFATGTETGRPGIALNTKSGETLVVWVSNEDTFGKSQIIGRMLDRNGKAIRSNVTLEADPLASEPSVAYNPITNEFLLVYTNNVVNKPPLVFVRRLSPKGRPKNSGETIITDSDSAARGNILPNVVFNPRTGGYTVIWVRGDAELAGMLLSETGKPAGPVVILPKVPADSPIPIPTDLAYLPSGDKLLLTYHTLVGGSGRDRTADFFLVTLDPLLAGIKTSDFQKINKESVTGGPSGGRRVIRLALPPNGQRMVFFCDNHKVRGRRIDAQGRLSNTFIVAFKAPLNREPLVDLTVAFSTTSQGTSGLLIGMEEKGAVPVEVPTFAQILDENAKPLGTPIQVDLAAPDDFVFNGIISPLPQKAADKVFRFVWFGVLDRVKGAGIFKLRMDLTTP